MWSCWDFGVVGGALLASGFHYLLHVIPAYAGIQAFCGGGGGSCGLWGGFWFYDCVDVVDFFMQVAPLRVHLFDEVEFPVSVPFFELFFAADGGFHGLVVFVPDEEGDTVF